MPLTGTFHASCSRVSLASACLAILSLGACATSPPPRPPSPAPADSQHVEDTGKTGGPRAVDLSTITDLDHILPALAENRVVFVGERHDRYGDHVNQLAVIRGLHERVPELAIGVEYIQQPFQPHLDAYIAGEIDEESFLRSVEYYSRWRFDYRLYRPIFRYARENHIPVVALNVSREITDQVSGKGIQGVAQKDRGQLPESIDRDDQGYRQHLKEVYERHPHRPDSEFEHFYEVQLIWDEGMAERAARYLHDHPRSRMVVLAGAGHIAYGVGIPNRLARRIDGDSAIVLSGLDNGIAPDLANYVLTTPDESLPRPGRLGIYMEDRKEGVFVSGFSEGSAAEATGLRKGDRIVEVGRKEVRSAADVKIALLDGRPDDTVGVSVHRHHDDGGDIIKHYSIKMR